MENFSENNDLYLHLAMIAKEKILNQMLNHNLKFARIYGHHQMMISSIASYQMTDKRHHPISGRTMVPTFPSVSLCFNF